MVLSNQLVLSGAFACAYIHSIKALLKLCFHSVPAYQPVLIVEEIEARWQKAVEGYVGVKQPRGRYLCFRRYCSADLCRKLSRM